MNNITRRGALAGLSAAAAFGTQANSAVSVGIIGTGGRGSYVGGMFASDPHARLAAICDIYPDRIDLAKTKIPAAATARVYQDLHELLAQPDIDAVYIATPVYLHPEHFEAAARAAKHIYCEKPAGASVAGVKRLLRAAQQVDRSKCVAFGFQQRFSPEYLAAEKILRSGQLGELLLMRSDWILGGVSGKMFQSTFPAEERKIRHWSAWRETSGDIIVEQDCHGVDVLNWFASAHPVKAMGTGGRRFRKYGDNLDHLNVTYEYPNGMHGFLAATQLAVKQYWDVKEQFFGSEGILETERQYYKWHRGVGDDVRVNSKGDITVDAVASFLTAIVEKKPFNMAFDACDSTFTSLLGRMAIDRKREVGWEEMLRSDS